MFDFGWAELLVIAAIAVLVVGPKELPQIMHALGKMVRRMQYARFAITHQFDEMMKEADLAQLRQQAEQQHEGDSRLEADEDELYMTALENMPEAQASDKDDDDRRD